MNKKFLILGLCLLGTHAYANSGQSVSLNCTGAKAMTFEVHRTAAAFAGVFKAQSQEPVSLVCKDLKQPRGSMIQAFDCVESRAGDGRIMVAVTLGGFANKSIAEVSQGQVYPLPPKHIATLNCQ